MVEFIGLCSDGFSVCFSFFHSLPPSPIALQVGFKPAGGIRSAKDVLAWLSLMKEELGDEYTKPDLFRIGASSLLGAYRCVL